MPRYAPAMTPAEFLAKAADFLGSKKGFVAYANPSFATDDDILEAIETAFGCEEEFLSAAWKDVSKISFDLENVAIREPIPMNKDVGLYGVVTRPSGLSFVAGMAGGDWECPVFFILYHDGKAIRGYVPTAGNCFNKKTKTAWGNDDDADHDAFVAEFANHPFVTSRSEEQLRDVMFAEGETPAGVLDPVAILADIDARIQVR